MTEEEKKEKKKTLDEWLNEFPRYKDLTRIGFTRDAIIKAVTSKFTAEAPVVVYPKQYIKLRPEIAGRIKLLHEKLRVICEKKMEENPIKYPGELKTGNIVISSYYRKPWTPAGKDVTGEADLTDPFGHWTGWCFDMALPNPGMNFTSDGKVVPTLAEVWSAADAAGLATPFLRPPGVKLKDVTKEQKEECEALGPVVGYKGFGAQEKMHWTPWERDPVTKRRYWVIPPYIEEEIRKSYGEGTLKRFFENSEAITKGSLGEVEPLVPEPFRPNLKWWEWVLYYANPRTWSYLMGSKENGAGGSPGGSGEALAPNIPGANPAGSHKNNPGIFSGGDEKGGTKKSKGNNPGNPGPNKDLVNAPGNPTDLSPEELNALMRKFMVTAGSIVGGFTPPPPHTGTLPPSISPATGAREAMPESMRGVKLLYDGNSRNPGPNKNPLTPPANPGNPGVNPLGALAPGRLLGWSEEEVARRAVALAAAPAAKAGRREGGAAPAPAGSSRKVTFYQTVDNVTIHTGGPLDAQALRAALERFMRSEATAVA